MRVVISALLALVLFSCTSDKDNLGLADCWQYTKVLKDSNSIKLISDQDLMCLNKDSSFYYILAKEMIYASGNWSVKDSTLSLNYDYIPSGIGLDSVVVGPTGLINYYLGAKPVKRMGMALSMTTGKSYQEVFQSTKDISRKIRNYRINQLSEQQLVISENGISFHFQRKL